MHSLTTDQRAILRMLMARFINEQVVANPNKGITPEDAEKEKVDQFIIRELYKVF